MDMKKIIIAVIILLVIVVGAFYILSSQPKTLKYDDHFSVTIPGDFKTTEENGSVSSAYPANKSYVVEIHEEQNTNASDVESTYGILKGAQNLSVVKDTITGVKQYDVGKNKAYDLTTTDETIIKEGKLDAKKVRSVSFIVPDSQKVYSLYFSTNNTSTDLNTPEIESIINSTSPSTAK